MPSAGATDRDGRADTDTVAAAVSPTDDRLKRRRYRESRLRGRRLPRAGGKVVVECVVVVALACAAVNGTTLPPLFSPHVINTPTTFVMDVFPVDMDGDGDVDVLYSYFPSILATSGTAAWAENLGGAVPVFTSHDIVSGAQASVRAADIDNDGDMDVIAIGASNVWLLTNSAGAPAFPVFVKQTYAVAPGVPGQVRVADLDSDGDVDIAVGPVGLGTMWLENVVGDFVVRNLTVPSYRLSNLIAVDVDNDGDTDVLGSHSTATPAWLENSGDHPPVFSNHSLATLYSNAPTGLGAFDGDGDGDVDIMSCSDAVVFHENTGGSPPTFVPRSLASLMAQSLTIADVDGDGNPDVVVLTNSATSSLLWYKPVGGTPLTFTSRTLASTSGNSAFGATVAVDMDGDGYVPLIFFRPCCALLGVFVFLLFPLYCRVLCVGRDVMLSEAFIRGEA